MQIHSIVAESKWPIDDWYGENPPVETVVKLWLTASYGLIPASR